MGNIDIGGIETAILDNLPFGISVQTTSFELLYQNKFILDFFGDEDFQFCYHRWKEYHDFGEKMCNDCPIQATTVDNQNHAILRKVVMQDTGTVEYIKIHHQPILNEDEKFDRFIEIITKVEGDELRQVLALENFEKIREEIYFSLTNFGDIGGEIVSSEDFRQFNLEGSTREFLLKLSQFWYIAIGQGDNWPTGLFGPLPVFDKFEYDSYAYSFRTPNKSMSDTRFEGKDACLLIFIVRKGNGTISTQRTVIRSMLDDVFDNITDVTELSDFNFSVLKGNFMELIAKH